MVFKLRKESQQVVRELSPYTTCHVGFVCQTDGCSNVWQILAWVYRKFCVFCLFGVKRVTTWLGNPARNSYTISPKGLHLWLHAANKTIIEKLRRPSKWHVRKNLMKSQTAHTRLRKSYIEPRQAEKNPEQRWILLIIAAECSRHYPLIFCCLCTRDRNEKWWLVCLGHKFPSSSLSEVQVKRHWGPRVYIHCLATSRIPLISFANLLAFSQVGWDLRIVK